MHIEEDEEKVVIQMRPCGSGGRLVLEGKYEGPNAFLTVEKPQRMTYNRANFPVYCAHEPPMEMVDIEKNGAPFVVVEPAAVLGKEHCSFIIYKDPAKVPAKFRARILPAVALVRSRRAAAVHLNKRRQHVVVPWPQKSAEVDQS